MVLQDNTLLTLIRFSWDHLKMHYSEEICSTCTPETEWQQSWATSRRFPPEVTQSSLLLGHLSDQGRAVLSFGGTWRKMEDVPSSSDPNGSQTNGSESTVKCSEDRVPDILTGKLEDSEKIPKITFREVAFSLSLEAFY